MSKKKKAPTKVTKKEAAKPVKEPKKKHKGLIVLCVLLCIFVVFPIAFVFIAFFDTSTKNVSDKDVTYQNIVSEAFYNGLSKLDESNPKFDLTVNEEMIDGILMAGCEKINQPTYIPKMYCYIDGNKYTFAMDVQASFFKSRVLLHTTLDTEGKGFKETLVFQINKLTLGRLPIPVKWVTTILGNFVNDDMLNNAFASAHFHAKSHLSEAKITYDRETFKEDVGYYVSELGGENPFLNIILEMLGDEENQILSTHYHDGVTATFNLEKMTAESSKHKESAPLEFINLDEHKQFIANCLNENLFENETDAANMMTYFIRGFDDGSSAFIEGLSEKLKNKLETYLKITNLTEYEGECYGDGDNRFQNYCVPTIDHCSFNIDPQPTEEIADEYTLTFSINKVDINKYLAYTMTDAIGKTIQISFLDAEKKWGFNCIVVDNIYIGFEGTEEDPKMVIYLQLNINNVKLLLTVTTHNIHLVDTDAVSEKLGKISFELEKIEFGEIPVSTSNPMFEELLNLLPTSETEDELFMHKQDGDNHFFLIDLDPIVTIDVGEGYKYYVLKIIEDYQGDFEASFSGDTLNFSYTYEVQP